MNKLPIGKVRVESYDCDEHVGMDTLEISVGPRPEGGQQVEIDTAASSDDIFSLALDLRAALKLYDLLGQAIARIDRTGLPADSPLANPGTELVAKRESVDAPLLTWLTAHGYLCLALRHPQVVGPSRPYVAALTRGLGEMLVDRGVISRKQMENAYALEEEEGGLEQGEGVQR